MSKIIELCKKDVMLSVSVIAAVVSLFITPPSLELINDIDWKTLAILFMMLTVLEGFKKENIFNPFLKLAGRVNTVLLTSVFLIFAVFVSSMFVTNDVSLIIFVPLTIIIMQAGHKEHYILPVISMENIAAIRGSLLTPFGSPQNLFLFGQSDMSAGSFLLMMSPLWISSAVLLLLFILFMCRKNIKEQIVFSNDIVNEEWSPQKKKIRIVYLTLFVVVLFTIVSRTPYWPYITAFVLLAVLIFDRQILKKTDYVLLVTFLCFFIFSSSIAANPVISGFLTKSVAGHEYVWSILLSQLISNVPAAIVLNPFSTNLKALIYGLDTAGLCSIIGSLASVINYRLYVREYPKNGFKFLKAFTLISWAFFIIVVIPGYLLSR